jgi:nitrate reductase NapE component
MTSLPESPPAPAPPAPATGGGGLAGHTKLIIFIVVVVVLFPILGSIGGVIAKMLEILREGSKDLNDLLSVVGRLLDWVEQQCKEGKWYICWPGIIGIIGTLLALIFPGFRAKIGQKFTDLISRTKAEPSSESERRVAEEARQTRDEVVAEFQTKQGRDPNPAEYNLIEVRSSVITLKRQAAEAVVSADRLAAEGPALAEAFAAANAVRSASEAQVTEADKATVDAAFEKMPDPRLPE